MKLVSLGEIRAQAAKRVDNLLVLVVVVIAFFATPCISLAHEAGNGGNNSSGSNIVATGRQGLLGDNGCLSKLSVSRQDFASCLGLSDLSNLTSLCGNDTSDVASGANQQDGGNCLGLSDLSDLTSLCQLLGLGNSNPNSLAAGTKQQNIANCLGIPNLSNLSSLCGLLGQGNNPNSLAAGTKQQNIANCLGIPNLSNLSSLCGLFCQGNKPNSISASARVSGNQSSLPIAKLAGILQFTTAQTTSQVVIAQQNGGTLKFRIVPAQVASIRKGDFIGAYFNGKFESGIALGTEGTADLFDPVSGQLTTVQLN